MEPKKKGGVRPGAGRKKKCDELAMIERLKPLDNIAFSALSSGVKSGEFPYLKLFFEYRFGKPTEKVELTGKDGEKFSITLNL